MRLLRDLIALRPDVASVDGDDARVRVRPQELTGVPRYRPAPGLAVHAQWAYEARFLHDEIFIEQVYLRHGLSIRPGATVFDVGANIGLFSLFAVGSAPGVRVFAFEPARQSFGHLVSNTVDRQVCCLPVALGRSSGQRDFTYFPRSPVLSGLSVEPARAGQLLRGIMANEFGAGAHTSEEDRPLAAECYPVPVRTLAQACEALAVTHIDLLKIDVEGGELDILSAAPAEVLALIDQIVVEVHDPAHLDRLQQLMERHGFAVVIDEHRSLLGTGVVNLYARRTPSLNREHCARQVMNLDAQIKILTRLVCGQPKLIDVEMPYGESGLSND